MYRMFIVDDNKYERNGLKNHIDWASLGIEVVATFPNGAEALERIDELKPHLIVTDIAMPIMNGVQLSEHIYQRYPDIKVIFISCHSDFEFAKSAVDLGIYGYVLKPIIADELVTAVKKLVHDIDIKHSQSMEKERMLQQLEMMLPLVQEQFFKELLLGNFHNEADIIKRMAFLKVAVRPHDRIHVLSIQLHEAEEKAIDHGVADAYFVSYSVKRSITSLSTGNRYIYPIQFSPLDYAAIIFEADDEDNIMNTAVEISMEISRRVELTAITGISKVSEEIADISTLYKQAQKAVHTRFYSGSNPIITFEEIEDRTDVPFEDLPNLEAVYQDLKTLMIYSTAADVREFVDKYLGDRVSRHDANYVKSFAFMVMNITRIILQEANQTFRDLAEDDMKIWKQFSQPDTPIHVSEKIYQWLMSIIDRLSEKNTSKNTKVVDTIIGIIKSKYHEQITIEDISKSVYLSGRYANALFKKEVGKTIFDYVIEVRIDAAKKLLKDKDSRVASVAEEVGYMNTSYFCLAFKKNVGMTPAEYKSKVVL
ncbi:response regulator [Paenibacillus sp. BC26]|uniref:response regulator transcription factor n=1 Tax=Paenibacillus sp. BC26 TaxID=1881032 RepID=UPI0008F0B2DB|nr:response regulator [Paenibacillus sp. BC26]SFS57666.1 Two-component response regulator, YesN/AraC family, consists of REC and AraC-type DNA-binding domains [Paenibacillus sp. BC26]